jgi:hypothetical protein
MAGETEKPLQALTLRHPWAYAITHLGKRIENRTWRPPAALIGRSLAIHGGAVPKGAALAGAAHAMTILRISGLAPPITELLLAEAVTPGIVAVARVSGVVTESLSPWFGGPYGWVLRDVFVLPEPVAVKGARGLWAVPGGAVAEIRRQYVAAHATAKGGAL